MARCRKQKVPESAPSSGCSTALQTNMATTTFHCCGELPKELRLLIWEAAIPAPRIVELDRQPNKAGHDEFYSRCEPPALLFACYESYEVASKLYERAFVPDVAVTAKPNAYFDFRRDILYLSQDVFKMSYLVSCVDEARRDWPAEEVLPVLVRLLDKLSRPQVQLSADARIRWLTSEATRLMSPRPFAPQYGSAFVKRVEKIAIHMENDDDLYDDWGSDAVHQALAGLLRCFESVKQVSIVARHVGNCPGNHSDHTKLSMYEPLDTNKLAEDRDLWNQPTIRTDHGQFQDLPRLCLEDVSVDMTIMAELPDVTAEEILR